MNVDICRWSRKENDAKTNQLAGRFGRNDCVVGIKCQLVYYRCKYMCRRELDCMVRLQESGSDNMYKSGKCLYISSRSGVK